MTSSKKKKVHPDDSHFEPIFEELNRVLNDFWKDEDMSQYPDWIEDEKKEVEDDE